MLIEIPMYCSNKFCFRSNVSISKFSNAEKICPEFSTKFQIFKWKIDICDLKGINGIASGYAGYIRIMKMYLTLVGAMG